MHRTPEDPERVLPLTLLRMDFAARVRTADGSERQVLIEIQKASAPTVIERFRRYLGQQIGSGDNILTHRSGRTEAGGRSRSESGRSGPCRSRNGPCRNGNRPNCGSRVQSAGYMATVRPILQHVDRQPRPPAPRTVRRRRLRHLHPHLREPPRLVLPSLRRRTSVVWSTSSTTSGKSCSPIISAGRGSRARVGCRYTNWSACMISRGSPCASRSVRSVLPKHFTGAPRTAAMSPPNAATPCAGPSW